MRLLFFFTTFGGAAALSYASFRSPPVSLRSGQIANTVPVWGPLDFVPGPVAVHSFAAEIVDDDNRSVPLNEVYLHHWLVYNGIASGNINGGVCTGLPNLWGIGAERYTYEYPPPYAIVTTGKEEWTVNLHIIRTTNVPDVQMCIECHCPESNLPRFPKGSVNCCPDSAQCWGMENSTLNDAKNYYLFYTVGYGPITDETKPLTAYSMDATSKKTYDCLIEYQIPELKPGDLHTITSLVTVPTNWSLVFMAGHQHIGGERYTVEHVRDNRTLAVLCDTKPVYGTGSETGYLVGMPPCIFNPAVEIRQYDQLRLTSTYSGRTIPGGHPWHEGVMALNFLYAVAAPDPRISCVNALYRYCGGPPYASFEDCIGCAQAVRQILLRGQCTDDMIMTECKKTDGGGNIPVPPQLSDVSFHAIQQPDGGMNMNLTGPSNSWMAVGFNEKGSFMDGTVAWVYTINTLGQPVVQQRRLGNHFEGDLLVPSVPANITQRADGKVEVLVHVPAGSPVTAKRGNPMAPQKECFLFAQGSPGSMILEYHAFRRGQWCGY